MEHNELRNKIGTDSAVRGEGPGGAGGGNKQGKPSWTQTGGYQRSRGREEAGKGG